MPVHALHQQLLPATGASYVVSCNLTPTAEWIDQQLSQTADSHDEGSAPSSSSVKSSRTTLETLKRWRAERGELISHVVTAKEDCISVYEVRRRSPQQADQERGRDRIYRDHFASIAEASTFASVADRVGPPSKTIPLVQGAEGSIQSVDLDALAGEGGQEELQRDVKLFLLRRHTLYGVVTGLQSVRTKASAKDGRDRILVSFKDAKVSTHSQKNGLAQELLSLL